MQVESKQKAEIATDVEMHWKALELYAGKRRTALKNWILMYPRNIAEKKN